jgi:hypothetical protein
MKMNIVALVALIQAGVVVSKGANGNGNANGKGNGAKKWDKWDKKWDKWNSNWDGNTKAKSYEEWVKKWDKKMEKWNNNNPTEEVASLPPVKQPPVQQPPVPQSQVVHSQVVQSQALLPPAAPPRVEQTTVEPTVKRPPVIPTPVEPTPVDQTTVPNTTISNGDNGFLKENENNDILNGHKSNGFEETKAPQVSVENLVPFTKAQNDVEKGPQNGVENGLPAASVANQSSPNDDTSSNVPSSNVTIGIVVGSILGIIALVFGILVFKRRKSRNTDSICSDATIDISIPTAVFMNEPDHSASDKIAVTDKQFVENIDILSTDTLNGQDQLSSPSSPSCNSSVFEASIADGRVSIPDGRESFFPENFRETRVSQESYGSKRLSTRFDTIYIEDMTDD